MTDTFLIFSHHDPAREHMKTPKEARLHLLQYDNLVHARTCCDPE